MLTFRPQPESTKMSSDVAAKIFDESIGKVVLVELKGGRTVRGKLYSYDQHMNLVLEDADDITNPDNAKRIGTIIVRGDNVVLVSPPPSR
jgi:small nuclear ribonucleoprotein